MREFIAATVFYVLNVLLFPITAIGYIIWVSMRVLWEGVTMYLDGEAIESTLRKIASCARGSVVAFDYFTTEILESRAPYWRYGMVMTRLAGEPLKFGIDSMPPSRERLADLLRFCGLCLGEQRTLGQETADKRAWGGFATAIVKQEGVDR